jgi:hypothetical protein
VVVVAVAVQRTGLIREEPLNLQEVGVLILFFVFLLFVGWLVIVSIHYGTCALQVSIIIVRLVALAMFVRFVNGCTLRSHLIYDHWFCICGLLIKDVCLPHVSTVGFSRTLCKHFLYK